MIEIKPYVWEGDYATWRADAPHDPGLCADLRAGWMAPGERLILRTCEMIGYPEGYIYDDHYPPAEPETRGKHYQHISHQWDASEAPNRLFADCTAPGKARFTVDLQAGSDYLDILLTLRNDMDRTLGPIDWPFCVIALETPTLRNPDNDRTYVWDGDRLRSLLDVNGVAGEDRITLLTVKGGSGFVPVVHKHLPIAPVHPQESVLVAESEDGKHALGLGFEQSYCSFYGPGNMCLHMDPYFATLEAGEEKKMRGRLYLIEGTAKDAFERYVSDFGA